MLSARNTGKASRRPRYWTVVRQGDHYADVFAVDPDGHGEALAVFGFREEAELFLRLEEMGTDWHIRETTAGELVSVLYGPCADIERVVIDPLPRSIPGATCAAPLSIGRADFTRVLVEKVGTAAAMPALVSLRP